MTHRYQVNCLVCRKGAGRSLAKIKRGGTHNTAKFTCSQPGISLEYGLEHWDWKQGVAQSYRMPVRENDRRTMLGFGLAVEIVETRTRDSATNGDVTSRAPPVTWPRTSHRITNRGITHNCVCAQTQTQLSAVQSYAQLFEATILRLPVNTY